MDMSFTPEQEAFRNEVREWIQSAMPPHIRAKAEVDGNFDAKETKEWHKILHKKGWVAPHWPEEYGGTGWDTARRFIFSEEIELSGAPALSPVRAGDGRPADHPVRQRAAEAAFLAEDPERAKRSGARATPSPTPAAIWPRCSCAPKTRATTSC